jgi:hypothetical protein
VIEREKQARGFESIDDTPIGVDVWGVEVDAFMRGSLYNRVTYEDARENCPVLWAEMNAIEEEFRQFLKPGVEVPTRKILSRLRCWRLVALRIEFAMKGEVR